MEMMLNETEIRVLGSLIEKALSTPEYYPLSLNALTNACNQKSNRDPVVSHDENTVVRACEDLEKKGLVRKSGVGRVIKYEERFTRERDLVAGESSVLCVLFLRGPQTAGEIRGRTGRMHAFESLEALLETLNNLQEWGYIKRMARLPGHKESRYGHLLSGEPEVVHADTAPGEAVDNSEAEMRMDRMARDIEDLRQDIDALKEAFAVFKKQFE
ncbi:MAG: YceH family protein [Pseudomonadota bacterium]